MFGLPAELRDEVHGATLGPLAIARTPVTPPTGWRHDVFLDANDQQSVQFEVVVVLCDDRDLQRHGGRGNP